MRKLMLPLLYLVLLLQSSASDATARLNIVVSTKPFYNMVAAVADSACNIKLLVSGNSSPHDYTLKPSDLGMLQQADVIFWGGDGIEPFLTRVLQQNPQPHKITDLAALHDIKKLPIRSNKNWQTHQQSAGCCHGHSFDPHLWLSITNAKIMVHAIATTLRTYDPANAKIYTRNAQKFLQRLNATDAELTKKLTTISNKSYLVFHDAYQYFEQHYGLSPSGAVTLHPEIPPSIAHVQHIKKLAQTAKVVCLFREPQLQPQLLQNLSKGSNIKIGVLDPVGKDADLGPNGYLLLLNAIAYNMLECLSR